MNLANKLTISRIVLAGIFIWFLFIKGPAAKFMAFAIFLAACITDYYDGYFARKAGSITAFGKLMDPIADKILILGAFLAFVEMEIIPAWMVMVIIARELVITGIRVLALSQKKVLAAETGGKHKTVSQMVAVITVLIFLIIRDLGFGFRYIQVLETSVYALMLITVGMTLTSGVSYMLRNKDIFMGDQ
ncbi:MAG: CDP-diacylglycerol--glycerol-3-phosphate 3-phosphatidyltransferase [Candidatus Omnitrophica bacterium CG_4_9_14_0_2_um_filter_42_8]|nr:MAG: CDP-diacylglycerol--glycerol-3-phosphate 3-phosphatidyltransferase [Candidatus Omnitrophica bacterium CG22_combo_CG10-13_8_21_14_all_43_16]PJC48938.1 MAG: CDP-diacylglycerol--glycerol-3-phosphate 3-phosphatidyltransferase [Candidatus Omnitrophica bacterium CG_4_9_14_0_2_um_filter_42_8]